MSERLLLGCHLSASKGFLHMGKEAASINATTFQFFTRNPRGGNAKDLDLSDIASYLEFSKSHSIGPIIAHAPYTLNACSSKPEIRDFATRTMADDLQRLENLPGTLYNFHPGSHVGQGVKTGIDQIIELLNQVMWKDMHTTILLETMAGKGSEIGSKFEELRAIMDGVKYHEKLGVCLDTCHVHDAGYDIGGKTDEVLEEFDRVIGLDKLCAVHINDSMNELGAHKDRHACIGAGKIGAEGLIRVVSHPALKHLPFCLETPNELDGYAKEIAFLRTHCEGVRT